MDSVSEGFAVLALEDRRWRAFVDSEAGATAFHRPSWARVLAAAYGFRPFVAAWVEGEKIVAGSPMVELGRRRSRRWVSLPFTDLCPPLGDPAAVGLLVDGVERIRIEHGFESIELRGAVTGPPGSPVASGVIHELELDPDPSVVRSRFHPSQVRRNVERAKREGVEVTFENDREALVSTFYRLHLQTRRRQGVPIQPRRFFTRLWEEVVAPGDGFVLVARLAGRPAASAVFLDGNTTLTYKFGASDHDLLSVRPNHALFWAAIEWACLAGRRTLDFGRTDTDNHGLRAFKSAWGARERPLVYTSLGRQKAVARDRARVLRPLIVHSPAVVCRALGEALYRRAA